MVELFEEFIANHAREEILVDVFAEMHAKLVDRRESLVALLAFEFLASSVFFFDRFYQRLPFV